MSRLSNPEKNLNHLEPEMADSANFFLSALNLAARREIAVMAKTNDGASGGIGASSIEENKPEDN